MDKQIVILKTQVEELQVVGTWKGGKVKKPYRVGEWWVTPSDQWTGTVPPDKQMIWDTFKQKHPEVIQYLILDDMQEVLVKRAQEAEAEKAKAQAEYELKLKALEQAKQEQADKAEQQRQWEEAYKAEQRMKQAQQNSYDSTQAAATALKVIAGIIGVTAVIATGGVALLLMGALAAFAYDPVVVAVMPDGRMVEVCSWWD